MEENAFEFDKVLSWKLMLAFQVLKKEKKRHSEIMNDAKQLYFVIKHKTLKINK